MKNIFFISCLSILIFILTPLTFSQSNPQWDISNLNVSNTVHKAFFVDGNTGWAIVGDTPDDETPASNRTTKIYKTTSAITGWQQQINFFTTGQSYGTLDIYFINANTGWASFGKLDNNTATYYVYKTINGGTSWTQKLSTNNSEYNGRIKFVNNTDGYLYYKHYGKLYKTTDEGQTWNLVFQSNNPGYYDYILDIDISKVNSSIIYACGTVLSNGVNNPVLIKSANSGNTWTSIYNGEPNTGLNSIIAINAVNDNNNDYVRFFSGSKLCKLNSDNSITTLSTSLTPSQGDVNGGLKFTNANFGIYIGSLWELNKSANNGQSWTNEFTQCTCNGIFTGLSNIDQIYYATPLDGNDGGLLGKLFYRNLSMNIISMYDYNASGYGQIRVNNTWYNTSAAENLHGGQVL